MIDLYDNETQSLLGQITEVQLRSLIDNLEETGRSDRDYYLDVSTLELLEEEGADAAVVQLLRDALRDREGMEVRWEEGR